MDSRNNERAPLRREGLRTAKHVDHQEHGTEKIKGSGSDSIPGKSEKKGHGNKTQALMKSLIF
jgi:hypothetical protein